MAGASWEDTERRDDPTGRFADLLDDLADHVRSASRHARIDESNRIGLLFGHACFAIVIGPAFALLALTGMASPSFAVLRRVPGNPWSMATMIGLSGLVLAVATWHRAKRWEFFALLAMLTWYAIVSVSLLGAVVLWLAAPGPPNWTKAPGIYPALVYAHLTYALSVHARTLYRKGLRR